jgi:uncharacterized cupin superfamily protein
MDTAFLPAGEGRSVWVVGDRYTLKVGGAETGGAFALVEALVPPGSGPPSHIHSREDEAFYVLEGELTFEADGRQFTAGPGSWVSLAKGSLHRFTNRTADLARILILLAPAGMENFFFEIGREAHADEGLRFLRRRMTSGNSSRQLHGTGYRFTCPHNLLYPK